MSTTTPLGGGYSRATASSSTPTRPASIQELAERAQITWDASKDFKFWLKVAEKARHDGQDYDLAGDLENAFVQYARAATLILDKIPTHRDYHVRLTQIQRDTLITKGKGVLDRMGMLKPSLIDRHNAWESAQITPHSQAPPNSYDRRDRGRDYTPSRKPSLASGHHLEGGGTRQARYSDTEQERRRRYVDEVSPTQPRPQPLQARTLTPQRTRAEQEAILQRQREADEEARAVRKVALQQNTSGLTSIPVAPSLTSQRSGHSSNESASGSTSSSTIDTPPLLPLESPARRYGYDDDSTDPELGENEDELYRRVAELSISSRTTSSMSTANTFWGAAPPPITTTSNPPPNISAVAYPQLMTQHQRTQGYIPSFQAPRYDNMPRPQYQQQSLLAPRPKTLYQNILPPASQPVVITERDHYRERDRDRAYMYGPREAPPYQHSQTQSPSPLPPVPQRPQYESSEPYAYLSQVSPSFPVSTPVPSHYRVPPAPPTSHVDRYEEDRSPAPSRVPGSQDLRTVSLPREILPRFLAIAAVNTAKNRETCGLLLGKPRGEASRKLVVTTLLIPKQHSTSDTCNMDEEELVLEFTLKRDLITLGWIHTHPTQSCFMSSVDLHTHSGFQRMLPESFAVVCAPKHTPNFGIFRLTDPPGLQTILDCDQKNAFHPHPELPIYTDADKGHVQMRDFPLEIVDLR